MSEAEVPPEYHRLAIPTPFAVGRVNCWLLDDEPLTLFDTGPNSGKALDELEQGLAALGRRVEDLGRIVITHQHIDHEGLLPILARRSGAEVVTLDLLAPLLERFGEHAESDDAMAEDLMRHHGVSADVATALRAVSRMARGWGAKGPVDTTVGDGGTLAFAGRTLEVHHRPGHSPSDTVFHDTAREVLIGGDHLLPHISSNPVLSRPIGGKSGAVGSEPHALRTYLASMRETAAMDGVAVVLPGHGDPMGGHAQLIADRFAMHERRARKIARLLTERGPLTAHEVAHELWGGVALTQAFLTLSEVLGHADLLLEEGAITRLEDDDGLVRFAAVA